MENTSNQAYLYQFKETTKYDRLEKFLLLSGISVTLSYFIFLTIAY